MQKKTKKELRKFALKNRFKLGGLRYNKDYEPMIDFAYHYNQKEIRELEIKNSKENNKIIKRRSVVFSKLKKQNKNWSPELNSVMVDISNNAERSLNLSYAKSLLKMFKDK